MNNSPSVLPKQMQLLSREKADATAGLSNLLKGKQNLPNLKLLTGSNIGNFLHNQFNGRRIFFLRNYTVCCKISNSVEKSRLYPGNLTGAHFGSTTEKNLSKLFFSNILIFLTSFFSIVSSIYTAFAELRLG
jgi:hypothetical protein